MMKLQRWTIISLLTGMFFLPVLHGCFEKPKKVDSPQIFGVDPFPSVISVTSYYDVLSAWMKGGYRKMTVVHAGPRDGMAFIPEARMKEIKELLNNTQKEAAGENLITADNYLFAAARLGLIQRVLWIIPYSQLAFINAEERIQHFLRDETSSFRKKDIESMKFRNGCVSGALWNIETHICSPSSMPSLQMPVLMTLNIGFFPPFAAEKGVSNLSAMKEFFDLLAHREIRTDSLHLVSLTDYAARHAYLQEEALAILKEPALLRKATPALWVLRDQADNMLTGGGTWEASLLLDRVMKEYRDDPYLTIMRETAHAFLSEKSSALTALERLCEEKTVYCRAMTDIGVDLREKGDLSAASGFLEKALTLWPESDRVRMEYARTLYDRKLYAKASEVLLHMKDPVYAVSAFLLQGDCSYAQKREDEALTLYQQALKSYQEAGGYRLGSREQEGLNRLKAIYTKRSDQKGLESLDKNLTME